MQKLIIIIRMVKNHDTLNEISPKIGKNHFKRTTQKYCAWTDEA